MKNIVLKSSVLLICLALTPSSFARGKGGGKGKGGGGNGIFKQLDLSEEQRQELKLSGKVKKTK